MDNYLGKKYKLKSQENFEEYLKFVDIGFTTRKMAIAVSPTACLTKNEDGSYSLTMSTSLKTVTTTFKPGEEFTEERADGVKVRSVITFEGDTMIQIQTEDNGRVSKHVRVFSPTTLVTTSTAEGWSGTCTRVYEIVD